MAKTKYNENFPLLAGQYAREGLTDLQISKKLGICKQTFYDYQKRFPDFLDSIREGKRPVDIDVENAFLKRALGFEYEEVSTEYEGIGVKASLKAVKKTKKYIPPDGKAAFQWLRNRRPDRWQDKKVFDVTNKNMELTGELREKIKDLTPEQIREIAFNDKD